MDNTKPERSRCTTPACGTGCSSRTSRSQCPMPCCFCSTWRRSACTMPRSASLAQPVCRRPDLCAGVGDTGAMKLALFGRTRGRGAKVEDWPDVQFIVRHKQRVPAATIVVKSRLLDVEQSLETTPEENLLMTWETIDCLQDHGLEVLIDLEHAMDAACGRRENGKPCDAEFAQRSLDYFHQLDRTVRSAEGEPHRGVRHQRRRESGRSVASYRRADARLSRGASLDFTATRIAALASPTRARRFLPARRRCRER